MSTDDSKNSTTDLTSTRSAQSEITIPRAALERVLARATELQAGVNEPADTVSESRMLEIAREVGIPAEHLRQALAEERSKLPYAEDENGLLLNALGINSVSAQRTVNGTPQSIFAALEPWMQRMEFMAVQRRTADRITWQPTQSIANYMRPTGPTGLRRDLARVDQITATITRIDDTRSVVRFDAQLNNHRRSNRNLAIGLGLGVGLPIMLGLAVPLLFLSLATGASAAILATLATVPVGVAYGMWRVIRSGYRRTVQRAQIRVDQLLDEIEHGTLVTTPSLLGQLRDAMLSVASGVRPSVPQPPPGSDR